jgi:hypothetical protein
MAFSLSREIAPAAAGQVIQGLDVAIQRGTSCANEASKL